MVIVSWNGDVHSHADQGSSDHIDENAPSGDAEKPFGSGGTDRGFEEGRTASADSP